jgi:hypothetical protein
MKSKSGRPRELCEQETASAWTRVGQDQSAMGGRQRGGDNDLHATQPRIIRLRCLALWPCHGVRSNFIPGTAMSEEGPQFPQVTVSATLVIPGAFASLTNLGAPPLGDRPVLVGSRGTRRRRGLPTGRRSVGHEPGPSQPTLPAASGKTDALHEHHLLPSRRCADLIRGRSCLLAIVKNGQEEAVSRKFGIVRGGLRKIKQLRSH